MNAFRTGPLFMLAVLIAIGSSGSILVVEASRHPNPCRILAHTGRSEARRDRESRVTCARVANRPPSHAMRHLQKKHERPTDRLRSRGEDRPKVSGDHGARRQLNRHPHSRLPQWHW